MKYFHPKRYYRKTKKYFRDLFLYYIMPDKMYLKYKYRKVNGKKLNLINPQSIDEKMQWLKLYDRNPIYTNMVDKYEAKKIVAQSIGKEYIIPSLGVWDKFDDIDFDLLPNQFVLKGTHDSGSVVICKDKNLFDYDYAKQKLTKALKQNYYRYENKQWVYKNIKPRILAEVYLSSKKDTFLEYQIFCNNGIPLFFLVRNDLGDKSYVKHKFAISYTLDWKRVAYRVGEESLLHIELEKPKNLEKMINIATILSRNIPHIRVDFYELDDVLYLGELTLCTNGGFFENYNQQGIDILSKSLKLPNKY